MGLVMPCRTRLTTHLPFLYSSSCLQGKYTFSTTAAVGFSTTKTGQQTRLSPRTKPQPSIQVLMKESDGSRMPQDLGLLEGTFIMPTGRRKPSLFTDFRRRLRLEWFRLKHRIEELRMAYGYKFTIGAKGKRPKLGLGKVGPTAQALYRQMYTAFAEGDINTLSTICTEGLVSSFKARIAARPQNERMQWTLHKFTKGPRFASSRTAMMPFKASALRQVVVRLQSRQSLTRIVSRGSGRPKETVKGTGEEKLVSEYVVLQRRMWKGEEGPWIIWGTTEETDADTVLKPDAPVPATA